MGLRGPHRKYCVSVNIRTLSEPNTWSRRPDLGLPVRALTPESGPSVAPTQTPSNHRGSGTSVISDWDSGPYEEWYCEQGGSGSSVGSGSCSLPDDRHLRSGQVWQTVTHRRASRGSGSPQGGSGSGTSHTSGSGLSLQPAQDVLAVVNQFVYLHGEGPDRSLCPCICISGIRRASSLTTTPSSSSWGTSPSIPDAPAAIPAHWIP